ncbi:MAG: ribonuclease HI [Pseudomonadota bacterium]|nr:ribonuclease HI [Pseudomonadota bacterium]
MAEEKMVDLYSDGACKGNPGVGGWGVLLRFGEVEKTLCGGARDTTNNRMELQAVIEGLKTLNRHCQVRVHTDSKYVQQGISEWMPNWIRRGWKTAGGSAVKNQDLWRELSEQAARHRIEWLWVKGHAGHPENERADALANEGVQIALKGKN